MSAKTLSPPHYFLERIVTKKYLTSFKEEGVDLEEQSNYVAPATKAARGLGGKTNQS